MGRGERAVRAGCGDDVESRKGSGYCVWGREEQDGVDATKSHIRAFAFCLCLSIAHRDDNDGMIEYIVHDGFANT